MAASRISSLGVRAKSLPKVLQPSAWQCIFCKQRRDVGRQFSASSRRRSKGEKEYKAPFGSRLRRALKETKVEWYPIPVGLGVGFLGLVHFYRSQKRIKELEDNTRDHGADDNDGGNGKKPTKRKRIRPSGPWYVTENQIMTYLSCSF